jgi:hypothetical protein
MSQEYLFSLTIISTSIATTIGYHFNIMEAEKRLGSKSSINSMPTISSLKINPTPKRYNGIFIMYLIHTKPIFV